MKHVCCSNKTENKWLSNAKLFIAVLGILSRKYRYTWNITLLFTGCRLVYITLIPRTERDKTSAESAVTGGSRPSRRPRVLGILHPSFVSVSETLLPSAQADTSCLSGLIGVIYTCTTRVRERRKMSVWN
jgi:hypothetical protein